MCRVLSVNGEGLVKMGSNVVIISISGCKWNMYIYKCDL